MSTHMDALMGDLRLGIRAYITPNQQAEAEVSAEAEAVIESDEPSL